MSFSSGRGTIGTGPSKKTKHPVLQFGHMLPILLDVNKRKDREREREQREEKEWQRV